MKEIKKSDTKKRKLRIRNNGIVLTAFSAGILCLAAIAAIMYQNITSSHTEKHQDSDSAISVDTDAQTDLLSDNNTTIFPDTDETENKTLDFDTEMSGFPTVSELFSEGYVLSSGTYDSSKFKLGVVETTIDFPMEYSRSSIMSTSGIGFVTVPVMKTYMGYIIYNDGSCVYFVYDPWETCIKDFGRGGALGNNVHLDIWQRSLVNIMDEEEQGISTDIKINDNDSYYEINDFVYFEEVAG